MRQNKSFIVRAALFRFFEVYSNLEKAVTKEQITDTNLNSGEKLTVTESELEAIVQRMLNKILKDKES